MTAPRFTVDMRYLSNGIGQTPRLMWAVFDKGKRITMGYDHYGETVERSKRIAALYARFGW